ncbi:MAG: hypothetical protein QI199_03680 [Candidatus Korarchaeota archaeon]|nr:hypothetical protein [Candidatus Korarchaeota archaeon]
MSFREELKKDYESVKAMLEDLEAQLKDVEKRISELESKYRKSSREFLEDRSGVSEEEREEWLGLIHYRDNLRRGLEPLRQQIESLSGMFENP